MYTLVQGGHALTVPDYHLYANGAHCDHLYGDFAAQATIDFYSDLASQADGTILELACGTGRLAIPLARAGFTVAGMDASRAMLDEARRKSQTEELEIQWVSGDIRDFDLCRLFGLILIPSNSICHILSRPDFEATVACVKRHLHPEGRFVVDAFVPAPELLIDKGNDRLPYGEYETPEGRVVLTHSYQYDWDTQIKRIMTYHASADGHEKTGTLDMRMYYPQELDALLEYNGLRILHKYGGVDRRPFVRDTGQQLIVCSL